MGKNQKGVAKRKCAVCGIVIDGWQYNAITCSRACKLERDKENVRHARKANPEKFCEYARIYRAKNPERIREYFRIHRAKNPERIRETQARTRKKNAERIRERERFYRIKNRSKLRKKLRDYGFNITVANASLKELGLVEVSAPERNARRREQRAAIRAATDIGLI